VSGIWIKNKVDQVTRFNNLDCSGGVAGFDDMPAALGQAL
jgi:hypothetical protein